MIISIITAVIITVLLLLTNYRNPTQNTTDRGSRQMYNMQPPPNNYGPPGQQPSNNNNLGHHHLHHPHSSNHRADFYMTRRAGDGSDNNSMHPGSPSSASASLPMGKQQHIFRPNRPQPPAALNFEQIRQTSADISETDLYLLSAIEKLVHRVDYLEKRLQTTDKLILHLLNDVSNEKPHAAPATPTTTTASSPGTAVTKPSSDSAQSAATTRVPSSTTTPPKPTKPPQSAPSAETALCPRDYVAIAKICYHFDRSEHADWKTANGRCRSLGGHLAEFSNAREFKAVTEFLANGTTRFTNASYWLGGLNPGLLWIWSGSAKPVNPASNLAAFGGGGGGGGKNSTTVIPSRQGDGDKPSKTKNVFDIQGNGRCLNLQYNRTLRSFEYYGEDCSRPHGFVCEMRNRNVENEISRVFRALRLE